MCVKFDISYNLLRLPKKNRQKKKKIIMSPNYKTIKDFDKWYLSFRKEEGSEITSRYKSRLKMLINPFY